RVTAGSSGRSKEGTPTPSRRAPTVTDRAADGATTHHEAEKGRMNNGLPGARLRRVTEFIEDNLPRALPLGELGVVAHLSPCHLTRVFKRATGLSPHQFIVRRRIDRARVLLAARELSIGAVGHAVGFRSCSHFSATFRRGTGTSPSVYQT